MSGRRSRRTRGEKPELVPPKSDEEAETEDNDSDEKANETTVTRGRGRRGKRVGSSSSLPQLATASKKPASRKKASAKATATPKKKRGRPRGRPRTRSPTPSESSIEEQEDIDDASENEASDAEDSNDPNNEGSEEDEEEEDDDDDAERDTEDDAPKEALTGKKKSTRKSRKKKGQEEADTPHPRYKNPVKIECRNCGKLCFSQGIKIHEKSCMPVYTPREDSKNDEASGSDDNSSDSSDGSSSPVVTARKNTRLCKHCGNMVSSRGFMQHERSCKKKAMDRDDDGTSENDDMETKSVDDSSSSSVVEEDPPKKKRGRKPKAKAAPSEDDASSSDGEEKPAKRKRGRKATTKAGDDDESLSQTEKRPKKRGRPPKAKQAADSGDDDESSSVVEKPPKKRGRTPRSKQGDDSLATVGEKTQTKRGRKPKAKSVKASADDSSSSSEEQPPKKRGRKPKAKSSTSQKATEESDEEGSDRFSEEDLLPISALAMKKPPVSSSRGRKADAAKEKKTPKNSKLSKAAAKAKTAPITNFFSPKASGSAKLPVKTDEDENENKAGNEAATTPAKEENGTGKAEVKGKTIGDTERSSETTGGKVGQNDEDSGGEKIFSSAATTETSKSSNSESAENAKEKATQNPVASPVVEKDLEKDSSKATTVSSTRATRKRKLTMKAAAIESTKTEERKEGTDESKVTEGSSSKDKKASENEDVKESNSNVDNTSLEGQQGIVSSDEGTTDLSKDQKSSGSIVEAAKNAAAATLAMFPLFSAKSKTTEESKKTQMESEDTGLDDETSEQSAQNGDKILKEDNTKTTSESTSTITDTASLDQDKAIGNTVQQPRAQSSEPQSNEQLSGKENGLLPPTSNAGPSSSDEVDATQPMDIDSTGKDNGDMIDNEADPNDSMPSSSSEKANGDSVKDKNTASEATSSLEVEEVSKAGGDARKTIPDGSESSATSSSIPQSTEFKTTNSEENSAKVEENKIIPESPSIKTNGDIAGNETSQSSAETATKDVVTAKEIEKNNQQSKHSATADEVPEAGSIEVEEKAMGLEIGEKSTDEQTVATEGNTGGADSQNLIEDTKNQEFDSKQHKKDEIQGPAKESAKEKIDISQRSEIENTTESILVDVPETAQEVSAETKLEVSRTEPTKENSTAGKEVSSNKPSLHVSVDEQTESKEQSDTTTKLNQEELAEKSGNAGQTEDSAHSLGNTEVENGNGELSEGIKPNAADSDETIQTEASHRESANEERPPKETEETSLKDTEETGAKMDSSVPLQADDIAKASQDASLVAESGEKKSVSDDNEMVIDTTQGSSIEAPLADTAQVEIDPAVNIDVQNERSSELATQDTKSKETYESNTALEEATNAGEVKVTPERPDSTMDVEIPTETLSELENDIPSPKVEMKVSWLPLSKAPRQTQSIKDNNQFIGYDESKTNRVKMLLYTTGSKIHRGKGFERIFGMYWDAVCLRLSRPLNGNASKRCDQAISAFLQSKKLRKIHNKFVMSIMRRALKDRIPYSEVCENIPSRWLDRVKVPHVTASRRPPKKKVKTFYDGLEEDLLQLSSVPHIDGTTPYKDRWECPTDAVDEIYKNPQEGPSVPIASSCIPGALVVDPVLRETVEAGGMKVTDNAMWLLTVALKEHIKNILNDSIEYKKGLRKGEIYTQAIRYPNVLASNSNKNRKISKGRTSSASLENGRKKQINSIDLFAALNMLPSGQPSSIGGSISRMSLEQTFLSGFNSIPSFDTGMGFNDVQSFISKTITEMAKTHVPEEKKAKVSNSKPSEHSASSDRLVNAAVKQEGTKETPKTTPTPNIQSPPLTSNTTPAAVQTPVVDSSLPKVSEKKSDTGISNSSATSQGGESRTAGVSGLQAGKDEKAVQQLAAGSNPANSGPPRSGAGRGAKNLAALIARATESSTASGANDPTQDAEKPTQINNNAPTDATVNPEPAKPNTDKPTNEVPKTPVESKPSDVTNPQSSVGAAGDSEPQESTPSTQSAAPVRRGKGKGFLSKDLAAMRARTMTSTQQPEEATAPKPAVS